MFWTAHEWATRPLVTLESTFWTCNTEWHGGTSETFKGGITNILTLQVECKYKKPYGGSARYRVVIDRKLGDNWVNVIVDEFGYYPPASDDNWHSELREYQITQLGNLAKDVTLEFRITTQIEGPGHMDTGSGGSLGYWSDPESRTFTATFQQTALHIVEDHFATLERYLRDAREHYIKKQPV